jgi:hypothetical protein
MGDMRVSIGEVLKTHRRKELIDEKDRVMHNLNRLSGVSFP